MIPTAEHVVIDDAAHMIPYEQPEAFLAALRDVSRPRLSHARVEW